MVSKLVQDTVALNARFDWVALVFSRSQVQISARRSAVVRFLWFSQILQINTRIGTTNKAATAFLLVLCIQSIAIVLSVDGVYEPLHRS
jgi:hypothetical protein